MAAELVFAPEAEQDIADAYGAGQFLHQPARRFPYAVYYEYAGGTVTIYCVFHTARDPDKWRDRLG